MSVEESTVSWTETVDVAVVGGGGAGMAAAASAAETAPEKDILLLQKIGALGGSTTMAVGSFAAAGTRLQAAAGIEDDAGDHFEDIDKFVEKYAKGTGRTFYFDFQGDLTEKGNEELRRVLVDRASDTLEWLESMGCEFSGPHPDPPHRVPRVHAIVPGTEAYPRIFGEHLRNIGVAVEYNAEVTELVMRRERVVGVVDGADSPSPRAVRARDGVILATGDFVNNRELRGKFTTEKDAPPVNQHNTGDGFLMGRAAGAEWVNMDVQRLTLRFGAPLWLTPGIPALVDEGAIVVNARGERFIDETADYDQLFSSTLRQPEQSIYVLFGEETAEKFSEWPNRISTWPGKAWGYIDDYRGTDVLDIADDMESLAEGSGFEPGTFAETVERFNAGARGQRIDPYGRTTVKDPIRADYFLLGPIFPYSTITEGGLEVDRKMRVLDAGGEPIEGLFAAGSVAGGLHLVGHGHHHSWIFTSGRIAGREIAAAADG